MNEKNEIPCYRIGKYIFAETTSNNTFYICRVDGGIIEQIESLPFYIYKQYKKMKSEEENQDEIEIEITEDSRAIKITKILAKRKVRNNPYRLITN